MKVTNLFNHLFHVGVAKCSPTDSNQQVGYISRMNLNVKFFIECY